jgi:hypothetical protein
MLHRAVQQVTFKPLTPVCVLLYVVLYVVLRTLRLWIV